MTAARIHSHAYENNGDRSVYVLLTDTGTLFTRIIKGFTAAPYNHASLALDAELSELYSFGRKQAFNPLNAGFVREDVYAGTYSRFPNTHCALLRLEVSPQERAAIRTNIDSFQVNKDQYSYNLLGLLGVLLGRAIEPDDSYFCSQFVAEVLRGGELQLWDRSSSLVTPNDFLQHSGFEILYEGLLYDYPLLDTTRLRRANSYQLLSAALKMN